MTSAADPREAPDRVFGIPERGSSVQGKGRRRSREPALLRGRPRLHGAGGGRGREMHPLLHLTSPGFVVHLAVN